MKGVRLFLLKCGVPKVSKFKLSSCNSQPTFLHLSFCIRRDWMKQWYSIMSTATKQMMASLYSAINPLPPHQHSDKWIRMLSMHVIHINICCRCLTKASFVIFVNISDHGRNYDEFSVPGTVETVPLAGWTGTSGATFYNYLVLNYLSPYTTLCDSLHCLCLTPAPVVCEMSKSCYCINAQLLLWSRQCLLKKLRKWYRAASLSSEKWKQSTVVLLFQYSAVCKIKATPRIPKIGTVLGEPLF